MGIQRKWQGWASRFPWHQSASTPSARLARQIRNVPVQTRETSALPDVIDLSGGDPVSSGAILEVVRPSPSFGLMPAAGGSTELREAIFNHEQLRLGIPPGEGMVATHGATGAFQAIGDAFLNRNAPVIVCDPGCPMHSRVLSFRGAQIRHLGVTANEKGELGFHTGEMSRVVQGARMLVLSQPNNPDGGLWDGQALEEIKWWSRRRDLLVVIDESHAEFIPQEIRNAPMWRSGWEGRALFVGSLSKSHAAAGARIGWVRGPEELIDPVCRVAQIQGAGISWPSEKAALRLLGSPGVAEIFLPRMGDIRTWAARQLEALGMSPVPAKAGIFLWMPTWNIEASSEKLGSTWMNDCRVSVAIGEQFGPFSMGHVRLNLAGDPGRLEEGLKRLKSWAENGPDANSWTSSNVRELRAA